MKHRWRMAIGLAVLVPSIGWADWDPDNPDDPAAHAAARQALARLGPDRGALPINQDVRGISPADVRDIIGLNVGLTARTVDVGQAITELGATVRESEILVDLSADVLFDFDRAELKPEAESELAKLAAVIRDKRKGDVLVTGHTDSKGTEEYNVKLSERRAEAVKSWLVTNGQITADAVKTQGLGESQPAAPNTHTDGSDNPESRAINRRVEIVIQTAK